jgi:hypothetical protein
MDQADLEKYLARLAAKAVTAAASAQKSQRAIKTDKACYQATEEQANLLLQLLS